MSTEGKVKSKDLSYDSTLPPFLQRLHAQNAGRGDLDRHERPIARPRLAKDHQDDDGPTVVDESGETLSKDEFEKLAEADNNTSQLKEAANGDAASDGDSKQTTTSGPEGLEMTRNETKVTTGTATKKRKVAKIIGEETPDENGEDSPNVRNGTSGPTKKPKRKAKPIKLAFDEEDDK